MGDTEMALRSVRVDAAILEYLDAIERGVPPERGEFLAAHASIANELREFLADYHNVGVAMSPPARVHDSTAAKAISTSPQRIARPYLRELPCRFGNFELLDEIARGGMGVVYRARQLSPNRIVALKLILAGQWASPADV